MKVLIVCSTTSGRISPFILDQVVSLRYLGVEVDFYTITRKGFWGYLKSRKGLIKIIKKYNPEIIHAHYGLSGLLAVLQIKVPVVITFHGSDLNDTKVRYFSILATYLSSMNIVVSKALLELLPTSKKTVIPCGVDLNLFKPSKKSLRRKKNDFTTGKRYILFASHFNNTVKNYALAKQAVSLLEGVELIELKGYYRKGVVELMNSVDVCLMTSFSEGSPQFIKEAMACNIPIVSTDVGDVLEVINKTQGCYISTFEPDDVAEKIKKALQFGKRTSGREDIKHLEASGIARRIIELYTKVLERN